MGEYQVEQLEALSLVRLHLKSLPPGERQTLLASAADYLDFRATVDRYLETHFGRVCDQACYRSRVSACCSREGIVTFFADVVINLLLSSEPGSGRAGARPEARPHRIQVRVSRGDGMPVADQTHRLPDVPVRARPGPGCSTHTPEAEAEWRRLEARRKTFAWPDRPVLFDQIEAYFLRAGCASRLMYLHNSPGLLRLKHKSGL